MRANEKVRALYLGSDRGRAFDRLLLLRLQQRSRDDVLLGGRYGGNPILGAKGTIAYGLTEVVAGLFILGRNYSNGRGGFSAGFFAEAF